MKVTLSDKKVAFLVNLINNLNLASPVPTEIDADWKSWVVAPITLHNITPREAKTMLTVAGVLVDYGVSVNEIIKKIFEIFIEGALDVPKTKEKLREWQQVQQQYKCDNCGLKSFITYYPASEGDSDIILKIKKDHKERSPNCDSAMAGFCFVGEPDEILCLNLST